LKLYVHVFYLIDTSNCMSGRKLVYIMRSNYYYGRLNGRENRFQIIIHVHSLCIWFWRLFWQIRVYMLI